MDWQQLAALFVVAATGVIFLWSGIRSRKRQAGCAVGCGCTNLKSGKPESIVFRGRKGERPQIVLRLG